jgi:hypothetical protein
MRPGLSSYRSNYALMLLVLSDLRETFANFVVKSFLKPVGN